MGARKDDITGSERAQIAMEMLASYRPYGKVTELARRYQVSRQTLYVIQNKGQAILINGLEPGPHGARIKEKQVQVNRARVERSTVVLTQHGVSQRDIPACLEAMLETRPSASWVNQQLAQREAQAAVINAAWRVNINETLSGDEIYSNGQPNLLVIGNDSLFIYALTRQPSCDGETWGCVLLDSPNTAQFASDGGLGLAAGAEAAGIGVHQLDWDHLLRPLWGQATRLERQAYAALAAVEQRTALFLQARTTKRLEWHLKTWERLSQETNTRLAQCDQFLALAQQVDAQFAMVDGSTGQLRDPQRAAQVLRAVGEQLSRWSGAIYAKLSANLLHWTDALFAYQPVLAQALAPVAQQWGPSTIQALSRLWQMEADARRQPIPLVQAAAQHTAWCQALDEAVSCLGIDNLLPAWQALSQVLSRSWRGSMLCECVNSLLRPVLNARKSCDQGCLELFRFLHNTHRFARGKRAGRSPAELSGIHLPADPLSLLGLAPNCQSNSVCF
jgi:hypothetical protein